MAYLANMSISVDEGIWQLVHKYVPREAYHLFRIQQQWSELAGPSLQLQTWPASLTKNVLTIHVSDHQWLHELHYLRQELLANICQAFPRIPVESLRLRLAQVPDQEMRRKWQRSQEETAAIEYQPALAELPEVETMQAMANVRDEELKHAIAAARLMLGKR